MTPKEKALTKERAAKAMKEMKSCGFPTAKTKFVLKKLLKSFDNNWDYIEAENYSVLVDSLISADEDEGFIKKKTDADPDEDDPDLDLRNKEDSVINETALCRKRPTSTQGPASPSLHCPGISGHTSLKRPKLENEWNSQGIADAELPEDSVRHGISGPVSPRANLKGKEVATADRPSFEQEISRSPVRIHQRDKRPEATKAQNLICYKEPKLESGLEPVKTSRKYIASCAPDESENGDFPRFEVPIAVIPPPVPSSIAKGHLGQASKDSSLVEDGSTFQQNAPENPTEQDVNRTNLKENTHDLSCQNGTSDLGDSSLKNIEIASSSNGEVKLSLSFNSPGSDTHVPSIETVLRMVEDRCLKSYKIIQPKFSLVNLMKEMCQTALELCESTDKERLVNVTPTLDSLKTSGMQNAFCGVSSRSSSVLPSMSVEQISGPVEMNDLQRNVQENEKPNGNNGALNTRKNKDTKAPESSNPDPLGLVAVQHHEPALGGIRPLHDVNDISKGEERVRISLVNEVNSKQYPPSFFYIPQNIVYQNGHVDFSLARIGDEDCCSDCFGNCLTASIPCACARETGGEYAYTLDGLMKKEFLDDCISRFRDPQKHHYLYCKDCPLERSKNEAMPEPCKGHLIRKFVKECWAKCGCTKQCGNRVVQRGITCNLQVFFTAEGKGWGLRTLDELPRGTFICEYVGEVLTNMELYDRTIKTTGNAKHTYPVLLDADWSSEGVLKDEEALCLDATFYGNVARFINHRCYDANLIEVPVEVETPDHHYYHLAFFTTRKVEAFEELTWDYGIDFDDHNHPVKAFRCHCGSRFCRDIKRSSRSKSRPN